MQVTRWNSAPTTVRRFAPERPTPPAPDPFEPQDFGLEVPTYSTEFKNCSLTLGSHAMALGTLGSAFAFSCAVVGVLNHPQWATAGMGAGALAAGAVFGVIGERLEKAAKDQPPPVVSGSSDIPRKDEPTRPFLEQLERTQPNLRLPYGGETLGQLHFNIRNQACVSDIQAQRNHLRRNVNLGYTLAAAAGTVVGAALGSVDTAMCMGLVTLALGAGSNHYSKAKVKAQAEAAQHRNNLSELESALASR